MIRVEQERYPFVKICKNVFQSDLSFAGIGALAILEHIKTNPKKEFNANYIEKVFKPYSKSSQALKEVEKCAYFTKFVHPTGKENEFKWAFNVDSFHQSKYPCSVVYLKADGTFEKGLNKREPKIVPFTEDFIMVPRKLLLDTKVSLQAKGFFLFLLRLAKISPDLKNKEEIRLKSKLNKNQFRIVWEELLHAGYLCLKRISKFFDFMLHANPIHVENKGNGKGTNKIIYFFNNSLRLETNNKESQSEESEAPIRSEEELAEKLVSDENVNDSVTEILFDKSKECRYLNRFLKKKFKSSDLRHFPYAEFMQRYTFICSKLKSDDVSNKYFYAKRCAESLECLFYKEVSYSGRRPDDLVREWLQVKKDYVIKSRPRKKIEFLNIMQNETDYDELFRLICGI